MHCTNCGAPLQPGETVCGACGAKVVSPQAYQQQPAGARSYPQQQSQNPQPAPRAYPQQSAAPQAAPRPAPQAAPQSYPPQSANPQPYVNNIYINADTLPPQYRPLGPWAYFGLTLLFTVPVVGLVFLIVFSFNSSNINRRNYARSYWCFLLIALIVGLIVLLIMLATGAIGSAAYRNYYY